MIRLRRFKLRRRVRSLFWFILCRKNRQCFRYRRIGDPTRGKPRSICKLFTHLKSMAKTLYQGRISDREFKPLLEDRRVEVPKGKTAVYVGSEDGGDFHRYLVPVVYFNHPLFGQLLKAAEEEFGYDHQGGITIPCPTTEFERVRTRIAAGCGARKMMTWKKGT